MSKAAYENLGDLRKRLANLRLDTVASLTGIPKKRLAAVEQGDPPSVLEIEHLAAVYGVDPDALWDDPIRLDEADAIGVLTSQEEFRQVGDMTRAKMLRAASAARDLVTLRRLLGDAEEFLPRLPAPQPDCTPYEQGSELAFALRRTLGLGVAPIASLRDLVCRHIPAVAMLYADLDRDGPAGLGFADARRGPAVVLNIRGKNENAAVRRFSLAHELCHLLSDWNHADPLASISGYICDTALAREQRANAFAARFLCPETVVQRLDDQRDEEAARILIDEYKLHYQAARLYLKNVTSIQLPDEPPPALRPLLSADPGLENAEAPRGIEEFPLAEVPYERRGMVAEAAIRAWSHNLLSRDACARFLGVTPGSEIERVADFLGMNLPQDLALAG